MRTTIITHADGTFGVWDVNACRHVVGRDHYLTRADAEQAEQYEHQCQATVRRSIEDSRGFDLSGMD